MKIEEANKKVWQTPEIIDLDIEKTEKFHDPDWLEDEYFGPDGS